MASGWLGGAPASHVWKPSQPLVLNSSPFVRFVHVSVDARRWTRELLSGLAKEAGASNPDVLAKQLVLLYDGAAASAQMDRDPAAAAEARAAAVLLIDAACAKRVESRA